MTKAPILDPSPTSFLVSEGEWTLDDALYALNGEYALPLGGVPVRYALPIPGQGGPWRTQLTSALLRSLRKPDKESLPCLDLWSATLKLVVADFDHLPVDAGLDLAWDWECFREYLTWRYGRLGLVVESPSGKAKILFVVRVPEGETMSRDIALDTLGWLLDDAEMGLIDRSPAALTQFLVREKVFSLLQERLNLLQVHPAILDSTEGPGEAFRWHLYAGDLPDLGLNSLQQFVVRFILGFSKRALGEDKGAPDSAGQPSQARGIALSQPFLVRQAEMGGFAFKNAVAGQRQISRGLKKLQGLGLLEVVRNQFIIGKKAKIYRVTGTLKDLAEEVLANLPQKAVHMSPAFIDAGSWNRVLRQESNHHKTQKSYEQWFYSLAGCMDKDREAQMHKIWKWHIEHV
jgi:hypothetical protein